MKEKTYNYVYITTNLLNGKQYVGDRSCDKNPFEDSYIGSGKLILEAKKKYGKQNFSKHILEFFNTKKEAFDAQEKYIIKYKTLTTYGGYNINEKGGAGVPGSYLSEETRQKISKSKIGIKFSQEHKQKLSNSRKGKTYIGAGMKKGGKLSEISKNKISIASKNRIWSDDSRKKISDSLTGHIVSKETKEKISISNKGKLSGDKNHMKGKSLLSIWTEKYGIEEANKRYLQWKENKKGQIAWNKGRTKTKINE